MKTRARTYSFPRTSNGHAARGDARSSDACDTHMWYLPLVITCLFLVALFSHGEMLAAYGFAKPVEPVAEERSVLETILSVVSGGGSLILK